MHACTLRCRRRPYNAGQVSRTNQCRPGGVAQPPHPNIPEHEDFGSVLTFGWFGYAFFVMSAQEHDHFWLIQYQLFTNQVSLVAKRGHL
jgi:hypothetical protein